MSIPVDLLYFKRFAFSKDLPCAFLYSSGDTPNHRHCDFYEFSLFLYGSFVNEHKHGKSLLRKNSLTFFKLGEEHTILLDNPNSLHFSFLIEQDFFKGLMARFFPKASIDSLPAYIERHLSERQGDFLIELANKMMDNSNPATREYNVLLFFYNVMTACLINDSKPPRGKTTELYVDNLLVRLNSFTYVNHAVKDIYKDFPIAQSSLISGFKQKTGYTIIQYHNMKKMEYARQLLTTLGYTVTEVSHMLNYSNSSHFSKLFREHHGVGPKEYQQRYARRVAPEYHDEREYL